MTMRWQLPNDDRQVTIPPIGSKVAALFCSAIQLLTVKLSERGQPPLDGTWFRVSFVAHVPADRTLVDPNPLRLLSAGSHLGHVYGFDLMDDWEVTQVAHRDTPWPRYPLAADAAAPEPGPCAESGCWLLSMGTSTRPEPKPTDDDSGGGS